MTLIFLDESGYTGSDLLDPQQPVFTVATINCTEEEARELKNKHFSRVRTSELKHSSLSRRSSHQQMVLALLQEIADTRRESVKFAVSHKQYALVGKMVDLLTETAMYQDGLNLYEDGMNIALTNLLYYGLPAFGGEPFFSDLLLTFQTMVRLRTTQSYDAFFRPLFDRQDQEELEDLIFYIKISHHNVGPDILRLIPDRFLDLALTSALVLLIHWRQIVSQPITVIHDASINMSRWNKIWTAVTSPSAPPARFGSDTLQIQFPLSVDETRFETSRDWAGLQIADVLAGAMTRAVKYMMTDKPIDDQYGHALAEILETFWVHRIWPSTYVTPEELGTTGQDGNLTLDYFTQILREIHPDL